MTKFSVQVVLNNNHGITVEVPGVSFAGAWETFKSMFMHGEVIMIPHGNEAMIVPPSGICCIRITNTHVPHIEIAGAI